MSVATERDFEAELSAADAVHDWQAYERIWEERRAARAEEISRLASRMLDLAPSAGVHVGITIKPALGASSKAQADGQ